MSDADNQTGGSGDPEFEKQPAATHPPEHSERVSDNDDENDNDVMTEDDLPSGG